MSGTPPDRDATAAGDVSRGLAAILALDAVGSSGLMERDSRAAHRLLSRHRDQVFGPAVASHRGRVFKTTGDGLLAIFASVLDAVECAHAIQLAMIDDERDHGGDALAYRIGIDLGDVLTDSGDVFGEGVNVAARLEAKSPVGGFCISQRVHDAIGHQIDLHFQDGGEVYLKNLSRPIRIYMTHPGEMLSDARSASRTAAARPALSIAVLPFDDMSDGIDQGYFCDGMTEDLITELAHIPGLFVIARHSSFAYKGKSVDIRRIGAELGVRHLVEGSVRRAGERLRVTAQLIEAESGHHVWAERYDRGIEDIFAVQDDVVSHIADALSKALGSADLRPQPSLRPNDMTAYEWVVRGRQNVFRSQGRAASKDALERAIQLDPDFSDAHAWLAVYYYTDSYLYHKESEREALVRGFGAADRAIETGPNNSLAHMALGMVNLYAGRLAVALQSLHRAIDLNPNEADALCLIQEAYTFDGQPQKGIESVRKAMRLNPHFPEWYLWHLGFALYCARDYEGAVVEISRLRDIAEPLRILAASLARLERHDEARLVAGKFMEAFPDFSAREWGHTQPFRRPEDLRHVLEGYHLAGLPD